MYGIELDEYSTLQSSLAALFMMLLEILIIIQVSFNILFLYSCLQLSNSFFFFFSTISTCSLFVCSASCEFC